VGALLAETVAALTILAGGAAIMASRQRLLGIALAISGRFLLQR